jgi:hypothetical protein
MNPLRLRRLASLLSAAGLSLFATLAVPREARAVDLYATGSVQGSGSAWSLDPSLGAGLRAGVELADIVGFEGQGRLAYGRVDERMLAAVSLGVRVSAPIDELSPVVPYGRVHLMHQHEEPIAGMADDVMGSLVGIGDAIRHRGGLEAGLGAVWTFATSDDLAFSATAEGYVDWFPDTRGPAWYGGAALGLGIEYSLGGRPAK